MSNSAANTGAEQITGSVILSPQIAIAEGREEHPEPIPAVASCFPKPNQLEALHKPYSGTLL